MLEALLNPSQWKMERKFVIRRRVFFAVAGVMFLVFAWFVATQIWWTSNGYCIGDMVECMFPAEGGK
jgi:multidrug resistance efflux pump